jgi:hypothetical protein
MAAASSVVITAPSPPSMAQRVRPETPLNPQSPHDMRLENLQMICRV